MGSKSAAVTVETRDAGIETDVSSDSGNSSVTTEEELYEMYQDFRVKMHTFAKYFFKLSSTLCISPLLFFFSQKNIQKEKVNDTKSRFNRIDEPYPNGK